MSFNKFSRFTLFLVAFLSLYGCMDQTAAKFGAVAATATPLPNLGSNNTVVGPPLNTVQTGHTMSITVNGSLCGTNNLAYANLPCVSVSLCAPGTTNCQTIDNILLDTGSFGLRLFQSVITVPLVPVKAGTGNLAECVGFGDGSSEWGQVELADLKMGGEPTIRTPIQVINSTYSSPPAQCTAAQSKPDVSPADTGFNGILGVGLWTQDCGSFCTTNAANQLYYSCSGSTCTASVASLADQITNPVSLLPVDNNGVILELPSVAAAGTTSVSGTLIFGIATQSDNAPTAGVHSYTANDNSRDFTAIFSPYLATAIPSFIDSGSSILFIPEPANNSLPDCATAAGGSHTGYSGLYCPGSTQSLSATIYGNTGGTSASVAFQSSNAFTLYNSGNAVFSTMVGDGGTGANAMFDWGLPFFFGKNVFVGIENKTTTLGTGPYWAF